MFSPLSCTCRRPAPGVPFAKQGRSHLQQSLQLRDTENLDIFLEFNEPGGKSEFVAAMPLQKTVSASHPVCCVNFGGLVPDFISHVSMCLSWALRSAPSLAQKRKSQ